MQEKIPDVSIILPIYNEQPLFLKKAIDSLIDQKITNFECIFIDDSTNKNIGKICEEVCLIDTRFHYIKPLSRIGLPASLNLGISLAKSLFIARFDSDDICMSTRFEKQLKFLNDNPDIDVLGGAVNIIDRHDKLKKIKFYPANHKDIERLFIYKNAIAHPAVIFRKEIIDKFGGYDESFRYAEDLELWLRFLNNGVKFANLNEVLISYREINAFREMDNWIFNIKARIKNINGKYFFKKLIGISFILLWLLMPNIVKRNLH